MIVQWDIHSWTIVHKLTEHTIDILSVAFSPDGKILASDKSIIL